jgi:hypothetical protein
LALPRPAERFLQAVLFAFWPFQQHIHHNISAYRLNVVNFDLFTGKRW